MLDHVLSQLLRVRRQEVGDAEAGDGLPHRFIRAGGDGSNATFAAYCAVDICLVVKAARLGWKLVQRQQRVWLFPPLDEEVPGTARGLSFAEQGV